MCSIKKREAILASNSSRIRCINPAVFEHSKSIIKSHIGLKFPCPVVTWTWLQFVGISINESPTYSSVPCFLRLWFLPQWAWKVTSSPSLTTCSCTTTPNMDAELEDWTRRKERRPTWSTVLNASIKRTLYLSYPSFFVFATFFPSTHPLCLAPLYPPKTCSLAVLLTPPISSQILSFLSCRVL